VCVFDTSEFFLKNIYVFNSSFEVQHRFFIGNPKRIIGEYDTEFILETDVGIFAVDIGGKSQRKIIIKYQEFKTEAVESTTGRPLTFLQRKSMFDSLAIKTTVVIDKGNKIVKIKTFFTIYKLHNFGFVLQANVVKVLDYSGEGLFLLGSFRNRETCFLPGKRFLTNKGRSPQDFYWDDQGNFYILELSPLHVEWLAVIVYSKARNFQLTENRILTGLNYAAIKRERMVTPFFDRPSKAVAYLIDQKTFYLKFQCCSPYLIKSKLIAANKPCGDLHVGNVTWRGELIFSCGPGSAVSSCRGKEYFLNERRQLLVWSMGGGREWSPIDVLIFSPIT
jgi:hypothetical protein